jgi:hypothetical protein
MAGKGARSELVVQVVPGSGHDAYSLVRDKIRHGAHTFEFVNKAKTRVRHKVYPGRIELIDADGVLVARIRPKDNEDVENLVGSFIGRLIDWFQRELVAVNVQILHQPTAR